MQRAAPATARRHIVARMETVVIAGASGVVGGAMGEMVKATGQLSEEDRRAIARYLELLNER